MDQNYLDRTDLSWAAKGIIAFLLSFGYGRLVPEKTFYALAKDDDGTRQAIEELVNKDICRSIDMREPSSICPPGRYLFLQVGG